MILVKLLDNLLLTVEMNRATHNDERRVERIIIRVGERFIKEPGRALDDLVGDALVLSSVVHAHVAENAERQLADLSVIFRRQVVDRELGRKQSRELADGALAKKRLNAVVVEGQVDEGLEQSDQIETLLLGNAVLSRVLDEALDHLVRTVSVTNGLSAVRVDRQLEEHECGSVTNILVRVLEKLIEVQEAVLE